MPVTVVAAIRPLPKHREEVLAAVITSIPAIHQEEGCLLYTLHDGGKEFLIIEQWANESLLEQHGASEAVGQVQDALEGKLEEPVSITVATPVPCGSAEKGQLVG
ncbi:putative quinol monooxygenase [Streptomyces sp. NPDC051322]|uniref:putative quinol monooxygenase n=1 Tax=Streptomyces sp. NPDC051322 TaxID=3154645 RepID=UPI00344D95E4